KALEKEPERRFPDVQAFINALEQEQNQSPRNLASTVSVQPTVIITPPLVSPPVMPSTAPIGFSGTAPASQVPPPGFPVTTPQMPVPPTFQGVAPMRVTPLGDLSGEPLGPVSQEFNKTTSKQLPPPNEPPARRPQGASVARRVFFAIGLV